jgi:hypothetical protein
MIRTYRVFVSFGGRPSRSVIAINSTRWTHWPIGWAVTWLVEKGGRAPGSKKGTELGLRKDCRIQKYLTHLAVDLVEWPPTLLLTLTIAD